MEIDRAMEVADFIAPAGVIVGLHARDKRQVLEEVAQRAAIDLGLETGAILGPLLAREELGSTGVGRGIAVPHARIAGLSRLYGLIARLERAVDFAAIDDQPVDLACLLLTPGGVPAEHLPALAAVSRRLGDKSVADRMRAARTGEDLYAVLIGMPRQSAAV
jgi:PTS system nitrogen regulatory IIA component